LYLYILLGIALFCLFAFSALYYYAPKREEDETQEPEQVGTTPPWPIPVAEDRWKEYTYAKEKQTVISVADKLKGTVGTPAVNKLIREASQNELMVPLLQDEKRVIGEILTNPATLPGVIDTDSSGRTITVAQAPDMSERLISQILNKPQSSRITLPVEINGKKVTTIGISSVNTDAEIRFAVMKLRQVVGLNIQDIVVVPGRLVNVVVRAPVSVVEKKPKKSTTSTKKPLASAKPTKKKPTVKKPLTSKKK
jgi:hypothetical protein